TRLSTFVASPSCVYRRTRIDVSCALRLICWFSETNWCTRSTRDRWRPMWIGRRHLFSTNKHRLVSQKQLRSFGFTLTGGFAVIGVAPMLFRRHGPRVWALVISLAALLAGLLVPDLLRWPYQVWMFLGECLGWVNSRIILGGLYYVVVTPMRVLMTLFGRDPMNRKFDPKAATYRVNRKPRPTGHMTHQF